MKKRKIYGLAIVVLALSITLGSFFATSTKITSTDRSVSTKEAERQTGISSGGISNCAIGKTPSSKGFIWIFPEDIDNIQERVEEYKNKKIHIETIVQLTYDFKFIKEWQNAAQAGRELSINYKNIHSVCNHKRNKAGGYRWMYLSEYNNLIKTTQN